MSDALFMPLLAAEEGAGRGVFAGTIWQSIAAILAFLILLAVLARYAWNPILTALQKREDKIKEDLEQARRAREEADQTLADTRQQLADARQQAQKTIDQSRDEARQVADQIKEQAQRDIDQMRERARHEIDAAREQAVTRVYEQVGTLATQIAGRILQREIGEQDQRDLIERSLEEVSDRKAMGPVGPGR